MGEVERLIDSLPAQTLVALRKGMLWNIRCAINYAKQQKQGDEELSEFAEELATQSVEWGAF